MRRRKRDLRPLAVVAYAAFIGLLLASYVDPLQQIFAGWDQIPRLESKLQSAREHNDQRRNTIQDLQTKKGIERAARERYGLIKPGETVYILKKKDE